MIDNSFWTSGNLVLLKEPWKPETPDDLLVNTVAHGSRKEYRSDWSGFTHGIIAEVIGHDHMGQVTNVSLHLYDPEHCCLYVEEAYDGVPTYVDYHVSELTPLRRATDPGYNIITAEERA